MTMNVASALGIAGMLVGSLVGLSATVTAASDHVETTTPSPALAIATPEPGQARADWLDELWLKEPHPSCPESLFFLTEVDHVK